MKSKFVTHLGIFAVLGSLLSLLSGALQLFFLAELPIAILRERFGSAWTEESIRALLFRHGIGAVVIGFSGILLGIGLLRRWRWARLGAIYFIALLTAIMVISMLTTPTTVGMMLYGAGIAVTIAGVMLHAGIIWKLRSSEVRGEFDTANLRSSK